MDYYFTVARPLRSWPGVRGQGLSFVLLRHVDITSPHYDLMLELRPSNDTEERTLLGLQTSELPAPDAKRIAWRAHGQHRRLYLNYEGTIHSGGRVERVDSGTYFVRWNRDRFLLTISGAVLSGSFALLRETPGNQIWNRLV